MSGIAPGGGRPSCSLPVLHDSSPGLQAQLCLKGWKAFSTARVALEEIWELMHGKGQPGLCLLAYRHCRH